MLNTFQLLSYKTEIIRKLETQLTFHSIKAFLPTIPIPWKVNSQSQIPTNYLGLKGY